MSGEVDSSWLGAAHPGCGPYPVDCLACLPAVMKELTLCVLICPCRSPSSPHSIKPFSAQQKAFLQIKSIDTL